MKNFVFHFIFFVAMSTEAQNRPQPFFEKETRDYSVCPGKTANALSEQQVGTMITAILDKIHISNSYIIIDCPQVENCQATVWTDGKPYILYNPVFLDRVKRLNFTESSLPDLPQIDWETLTLLAHELGHLVNNHFTNPKPGSKAWDWELEADGFAGFMIYMLKGKLADALSVYNSSFITDAGTYSHPGRADRKKAVEAGWNDAKQKHPDISQTQLNNKDRYDLYILNGDKLYDNDEYDKAIDEYNKAIELDPKNAIGYFDRGYAYYYKKNYSAAMSDFDKTLLLDPDYYSAYLGRARVKTKTTDYTGALADYNKLLSMSREAKYYYYRAGFKRKSMKDYQGALDDYDQAILLNKNNSDYYYDRGTLKAIYFRDDPTACTDIKKAADLGNATAKDMYKDFCDDRMKKNGYRIWDIKED